MGRDVKRVPMDFDWPLHKVWRGYLNPRCEACADRDCDHCPDHEDSDNYDATTAWHETPPPTGDGWQMWENTSEGSPISPVFSTPELLARWLADTNASAFGEMGATYDEWLHMITGLGYSVGLVFGRGHPMEPGLVHSYRTRKEADSDAAGSDDRKAQ